jgi:hypothetical protein
MSVNFNREKPIGVKISPARLVLVQTYVFIILSNNQPVAVAFFAILVCVAIAKNAEEISSNAGEDLNETKCQRSKLLQLPLSK